MFKVKEFNIFSKAKSNFIGMLLSVIFFCAFLTPIIGKSQCIKGDCVNGPGETRYKDGDRFVGEFENGKKKTGIYFYINKDTYEGEFEEGNREGFGLYIYSNGDKYEGFYKNDLKSYGQLNFKNGDFYKGNFLENLFHGYGSFQKKDGELIEGYWEKGELSWGINESQTSNKDTLMSFIETSSSRNIFAKSVSKKPRVFALIVGISDYYGTENDLRYADRDAMLFHNHLKRAMPEEVSNGKILLFLNEKATSSAIKTAIESIYKESSSNDFIIFYFSGHGGKGTFIPYDHTSNSITHTMIKEVFRNTEARFRLVVADACFSGSIGSGPQSSVTSSTQNLYDARLAVIMSSKPNQISYELPGLDQGVFSYYLIKGMQGLADMNRDNYVTAGELFLYTKKKVSEHTNNSQIPVIYGINLDKIPLAKIK